MIERSEISEMIKDYIKNNLTIKVNVYGPYINSCEVTTELYLGEELISHSEGSNKYNDY